MTTTIDPQIRQQVIVMARANCPLGQIGNETGLLDKEIRLIIDAEKMRLAQNPKTAPARKQLPPTRPAAAPASRPTPPPSPRPIPPLVVPGPEPIARLIDKAEASDIPKVRTAARRVIVALDKLKEVMAATETEAREKAAAKAKAEKEKAERAEKERIARVFRDELARQLEKAEAELAELTRKPAKKPRTLVNLTPEDRERRRQQALRMTEANRAKKAASA